MLLLCIFKIANASDLIEDIDPNKLVLVHLTNFLPPKIEGQRTMMCGNVLEGPNDTPLIDPTGYASLQTRFSLHFCLNSPVPSFTTPVTAKNPEGVVSWEKRKYAIIIPFLEIASKLVGGNPKDLFCFGPLTLPPSTLFIMPQGEKDSACSEEIGYEGPGSYLRVLETLNVKNLYHFEYVGAKAESGYEDETTWDTWSVNITLGQQSRRCLITDLMPLIQRHTGFFISGEHNLTWLGCLENMFENTLLYIFSPRLVLPLSSTEEGVETFAKQYQEYRFLKRTGRMEYNLEALLSFQNTIFKFLEEQGKVPPKTWELLQRRQAIYRFQERILTIEDCLIRERKSIFISPSFLEVMKKDKDDEEKLSELESKAVPYEDVEMEEKTGPGMLFLNPVQVDRLTRLPIFSTRIMDEDDKKAFRASFISVGNSMLYPESFKVGLLMLAALSLIHQETHPKEVIHALDELLKAHNIVN